VTNKEYAFSLFLILNGSLYYAFLISSITSLLSNKDVTTKMFRTDLANVRTLLQVRDAPEGLRTRINQFFHFSLARQCGCSENIFLNDIPVLLLKEIKHTYTRQLQQLPFFASLSDSFIELCVERLTYRTYVPGSVVFFQNERGDREVLLITSGKIELHVNANKGTLYTYMAGDSLGDFQLIFGNLSEVTAQASTFTEVMVLSLASFSDAIRVHNLGSDVTTDQWLMQQGDALRATIESHKKDLERFLKVRTTIEGTRKSKRMHDMMREVETPVSRFCIRPDSPFRPAWAAASLVGIAYFSLTIPLRIMVRIDCEAHFCLSKWDNSLIVDYLWDIFFLVDVILHSYVFAFRVFENDEHRLVSDRRQIFLRFWRSPSAFVSVLAVFPVELFSIGWGDLLVLRMSKLLWTTLVFDKISTILYYYEHDSAKKQALLSTESITILYLAIITFLVMLWTAVAWAVIRLETDGSGVIASLYWTMTTMTTVGFGDIIPESNNETLFVVIFCIIGPSCSASIIANAASFLNSTNVSGDTIGHRQVVIRSFLGSVMPELDQGRDKVPSSSSGPDRGASIITSTSTGTMGGSSSKSLLGQRVHPGETKVGAVEVKPPPPGPLLSRSHSTVGISSMGSWMYHSFHKPLHLQLSESAAKYAQVMAYLDFVENEKRGLDEAELMATLLPDYMQQSLRQASVMDIVVNSKFFAKCPSGFIRGVMLVSEGEGESVLIICMLFTLVLFLCFAAYYYLTV
jgi:CRP-like cAMP-binding protein